MQLSGLAFIIRHSSPESHPCCYIYEQPVCLYCCCVLSSLCILQMLIVCWKHGLQNIPPAFNLTFHPLHVVVNRSKMFNFDGACNLLISSFMNLAFGGKSGKSLQPHCCQVVVKVLSLHWSCSSITSVGRERLPPYSWEWAGRVKIQASHMVSTDPTGIDVINTLGMKDWFHNLKNQHNSPYQQTKVLPYDHLNRWQKKHSTNSTSATIERVSTSPCWSSLSLNSELLGHPVTSALRQLKKSHKLAVCSGLCWWWCDCNIQG